MLEKTNLAYHRYRSGDKGTLVLIHGFLDKAATWQPFVDQLNLPDWNVVALELENLTDQTEATNGLAQFSAAAAETIKQIRSPDGTPLVIVGHSMGGQVAELVAEQFVHVDGLILVVPAPLAGYPLTEDQQDAFTATARQKNRDAICKGRGSRVINASPEALNLLIETAAATSVDFSLHSLKAWTEGHPSGKIQSKVTAPVLLITSDDKFLTSEFLKREILPRFKAGTTQNVSGTGHWPHVEQPETLAKIVRDFLLDLPAKNARDPGASPPNGDTQTEVMRWFFHDYLGKWMEIGNGTAPPTDMLNFWGVPLHAASMIQTNWLMTPEDVLKQIERTQEPLKGKNYSHTVVLDHRITVFNSTAATIDALWSRRQKDETEIQRVASHFEIHMTDNGWRVVAMANRLTTETQLDLIWTASSPALPTR